MANTQNLYAHITASADSFMSTLDSMANKTDRTAARIAKNAANMSGSFSGVVKAGNKLSTIGSGMKNFAKPIENIGSKMTNSITKPAGVAAGAIGGMVGALGFKRLIGMDDAQAKIQGLGYSGKEVSSIQGDVTKAIEGSMTTMAEGTDAAAGALGSGVKQGKELQTYIKGVGNAAQGAGVPVSEMAQIFSRVRGTNKLATEELQMMEERLPGFSSTLAKSLGVSYEEMRTMVTNGEVDFDDFMGAVDKRAGASSKAVAQSFRGMAINSMNYIGMIGQAFLEPAFKEAKVILADVVNALNSDELRAKAAVIGSQVAPVFTFLTKAVVGTIKGFLSLPDPVLKVVGALGLLAVGAGPVTLGFAKITSAIGSMFGPIGSFVTALGVVGNTTKETGGILARLSEGFPKLGRALTFLFTNPIGIAIAALVALGAGFYIAYQKSETFRNFINGIGQAIGKAVGWIKTFGSAIGALFGGQDQKGVSILERLGFNKEQIAAIQSMVNSIKSIFKEMGDVLSTQFARMGSSFQPVITAFRAAAPLFSAIFTAMLNVIRPVLQTIGNVVRTVFTMILSVISGAFKIIEGLVQVFSGVFQGKWGLVWKGLANIVVGAFNILKAVLKGLLLSLGYILVGAFKLIMAQILNVVTIFGPMIKNAFSAIWYGIKAVTSFVWGLIKAIVIAYITGIRITALAIMNAFKIALSAIWNGIKFVAIAVWGAIKWYILNYIRAVKTIGLAVFNAMKIALSAIWYGIKTVALVVWGAIRAGVLAIIRGLRATGLAIFRGLKVALSAIWYGIKATAIAVWNGLRVSVLAIIRGLRAVALAIFRGFRAVLATVWRGMKATAIAVWNALRAGVLAIVRGLRAVALAVIRSLRAGVLAVFRGLKAASIAIWNALRAGVLAIVRGVRAVALAVFRSFRAGVTAIWRGIKAVSISIWNAIKGAVIGIAKGLRAVVLSVFRSFRAGVTSIWHAIRSISISVWNSIKGKIVSIARAIRNGAVSIFNNFKSTVSNIWNSIKNTTHNVWTKIKNSMIGFAKGIKSGVLSPFNAMKTALGKIIDKIKGFVQGMVDKVKGGLNKLIKGVNWVGDKLGMDKIGYVKFSTGTTSTSSNLVRNGRLTTDTFATVGDKGRGNGPNGFRHETIIPPNGKPFITPNRDTTMPISRGTAIMNGQQTYDHFAGSQFASGTLPKFKEGTLSKIGGGLKSIAGKAPKALKAGQEATGDVVNKTKKGAKAVSAKVVKGGKKAVENTLSAAGKGAGWLKDKVGDVMDWIDKPKKLLDHVLKAYGVGFGLTKDTIPADMMAGMYKKLKTAAVDTFKKWFEESGGGEGGWVDISKGINFPFSPNGKAPGYPFNSPHYGVDLNYRYDKLYSTHSGKATAIPDDGSGFGNHMSIKNGPLEIIYGHMSKLAWKGTKDVHPGSYLGVSGNTGRSSGPHLHYEMRKNGKPIDPMPFLKKQSKGGSKSGKKWASTIKKALAMNGLPTSAKYVNAWARQIDSESSGNPNARQGVKDVNSGGNEARGLVQVTPNTFRAYKRKGHGNITNPLDNLLAGIAYAKSRYGGSMLSVIGHGHGYANGGIIDAPEMAWLAEGGFSESVISHDPRNRMRSKAIHDKTGQMLGIDTDTQLLQEIVNLLEFNNDLSIEGNANTRTIANKDQSINIDGKTLASNTDNHLGNMAKNEYYNKGIKRG